jgi:signal transduction histidine kinase
VSGATVVLQDVTKLRRFDELKNDLVATLAHEMKTPLTSLGMGLHICLDQGIGELNEKQADLLFAAREDCERLQTIVDEILDLARIQSGKVELHRRAVPVRELIEQAVSAHQSEIVERCLTLELEIFDPVKVLADPDRIQLVLGNFVSNAVKYSPQATVIRVGAREEHAGVRFYVTDQGPGLPKDVQARIFEKFFRSTQQAGGAGLGLYIAREIVQAHEGQIGVESEPGRGSTFWFRIPKAV